MTEEQIQQLATSKLERDFFTGALQGVIKVAAINLMVDVYKDAYRQASEDFATYWDLKDGERYKQEIKKLQP